MRIAPVTSYRLECDPGELDALLSVVLWARRDAADPDEAWPWYAAVYARVSAGEPLDRDDAGGLRKAITAFCRARYGPGQEWPAVLDSLAAELGSVIP